MKVLVYEGDNTGDGGLRSLLYQWGYNAVYAATLQEIFDILEADEPPSIVLLKPGADEEAVESAAELCRTLRDREKNTSTYTYLLYFLPGDDPDHAAALMEQGADDWIAEPLHRGLLKVKLQAARRIVEYHHALLATNSRLLYLSYLDPLTGALSHRALLKDLDLAMYRANREKKPLCLVIFEIDGFVGLHHDYGESFGEKVLQVCVRRISNALRKTDILGRYDSHRFLGILYGVDLTLGSIVCRRLQSVMSEDIATAGGKRVHVSLSQALVFWDGICSDEALVTAAEQTLLSTSAAGANRIVTRPMSPIPSLDMQAFRP